MKEKYESLSLGELREVAKARGLKRISTLRKAELVERMLEEDGRSGQSSAAGEEDTQVSDDHTQESRRQDSEAVRPQPRQNNAGNSARTNTAVNASTANTHNNNASIHNVNSSNANAGYNTNNANSNYTNNNSANSNYTNSINPNTNNTNNMVGNNTNNTNTNNTYLNTPNTNRPQTHQKNTGGTYERKEEKNTELNQLDSGERANGILEVMPDGYGFIRCANYLPGDNDIYVSPSQIRRFNLKTGDILQGNIRVRTQNEKFGALLYVSSINGVSPGESMKRHNFEDMTPIFPNERLRLERPGGSMAMRIVDMISPIGKGQRGMIVSPPKAGKTTLLKDVAKSVLRNCPQSHLIILLIDERPEEVTDIKEAIRGDNVEVIYSTFDELPDHHKRVSEMVIERAKRLVEHKKDVVILLDSITRLARAYNLTVPPSGRTLSGGLDPAALHMPKRFFGAARNMREGGSLTILATALVDTGSKMDDVVYEEFKGTGNMELVLDRKLQEKRVFPAIDIQKSGTRREDLLLSKDEQDAVYSMRKALNGMKADDAVEQILNMFSRTRNNMEFVQMIKKQKFF